VERHSTVFSTCNFFSEDLTEDNTKIVITVHSRGPFSFLSWQIPGEEQVLILYPPVLFQVPAAWDFTDGITA